MRLHPKVYRCLRLRCFNPHPVRRPDETSLATKVDAIFDVVSIHIRSEDRMRHGPRKAIAAPLNVSIHIRSEDRMRLRWLIRWSGYLCVSIHIRSEDRMRLASRRVSMTSPTRFNPHPVRRPDETRLTYQSLKSDYCFNPHPVRRPDETSPLLQPAATGYAFQSTSGPKTG